MCDAKNPAPSKEPAPPHPGAAQLGQAFLYTGGWQQGRCLMIALELLHAALNASTAIAQTYLSSIQGHGLYRTARLPRKRPHKPMSKSGSAVEAGRGGLRLAVLRQARPPAQA